MRKQDVCPLSPYCGGCTYAVIPYEEELKEFKGVVGVGEAYLIVRNRILDLIAQTYPPLQAECERQKFDAPELPDGVVL